MAVDLQDLAALPALASDAVDPDVPDDQMTLF
jgi:hypothetical protein